MAYEGRRRQVYNKSNGYCVYCGKRFRFLAYEWTIDHLIPSSRGGSNRLSNLALACKPCNQLKSDKTPEEFRRFLAQQIPLKIGEVCIWLRRYCQPSSSNQVLDCLELAQKRWKVGKIVFYHEGLLPKERREMPTLKTVTIHARRSVSENYCTREHQVCFEIQMEPEDDPRQVVDEWTKKAHFLVDQALGDRGGPKSFGASAKYLPKPTEPTT